MVLLSFSVKEAELKAGTKIRTTRLYTPQKWKLWQDTIPPNATKLLDCWWKPRTKDGYLMFERKGACIYRLKFRDYNGRLWPCMEEVLMPGYFTAMSFEGAYEWAKEEGFKNDLGGLLTFFESHYHPTQDTIFQSIAFPPLKGADC